MGIRMWQGVSERGCVIGMRLLFGSLNKQKLSCLA